MPQPLTKPQFKTTTSADLYDVYEILLGDGSSTGSLFEPRPRVAYSPDDAVLALDELLQAQGAGVDDILSQLGEGKLMCVLTRMLACDGKTYEHLRRNHTPFTHDVIVNKMREFLPGAKPVPQAAPRPVVEQAVDEGPRMQSMGMPGAATGPEPTHPREKPKKTFKVTTVYQGGGDNADKLQDLAKQLTAENIPKGGLVITTGKTGPKILKAASASLADEDEAAANLRDAGEFDEGDEGGVETHITTALSRDLGASDDTESILGAAVEAPAALPAPKTAAPVIRTVSESTLEAAAKAAPVHRPTAAVLSEEGAELDMDQSEAAAMVDAEFAGMARDLDIGGLSAELPAEDPDHDTRLGRTQQTGGHRVQKASIQKKDRGGVRPQRPARS